MPRLIIPDDVNSDVVISIFQALQDGVITETDYDNVNGPESIRKMYEQKLDIEIGQKENQYVMYVMIHALDEFKEQFLRRN